MKIGFIGCVKSSYRALETLIDLKLEGIEVVAVVTKSKSKINADFVDLEPLCQKHDIPVHHEESGAKQLSLEFLSYYQLDVIYCFGWSYLLGREVLDLAPLGAVGFHPAPLPQARGRHPIIWALVLGLDETAVTFFRMDEGADSGPIVSQKPVTISACDDAASLYEKIMDVASVEITNFTRKLALGEAIFTNQDDTQATYWRKRSRKDGLIDWRMEARDIHNLIRALTIPYPGAEFLYGMNSVTVWKSELSSDLFPRHLEPGRILSVENQGMLVKCGGDSAIWLHDVKLTPIPTIGDCL